MRNIISTEEHEQEMQASKNKNNKLNSYKED
jgi:hypothetical protein